MERVDLSQVHFFHYGVTPTVPSKEVQGGFADVCSIAADEQAAESQALALIELQGFREPKRLAYQRGDRLQSNDWEELEVKLLAKALQRTPQAAALFSVWGRDRDEPLLTELPLPGDRGEH